MYKQLFDKPKPAFVLYRKRKRRFEMTLTKRGDQIWACGECGLLHTPGNGDSSPAWQRANDCCRQFYCECGNKIEAGYIGPKCSPCNSAERDARRIEKAEEIDDHDGPIYDDGRERYYSGLDEFMDWLTDALEDGQDEDELSLPEWVYPCTVKPFGPLDASSVVENELCDHHEDAEVDDLDELQAFLDTWCAKQTLASWEPDFDKKISVAKLIESIRAEQKPNSTNVQTIGDQQ